MDKQPTVVNATSHKPTIILLILNLIATIALLGHVFYYIPSSTNAAGAGSTDTTALPSQLESDGVGTIGLDKTNRVQFDLIKLMGEGKPPEVQQKITVTQRAFLDSFQRFEDFRKALEEKDLIRRTEE